MALSKRETQSSTVLIPGGGEKIKAGVAQENISHIIARLTKLYDNPIEAALREVFSNALDATLMLPEDERQPIIIGSPTLFEPMLTVEDFACGMSLDDVREIYANYGVSTKGEDLKAMGSYGLGGKAPLAYTDNFTVETTKNGITTVFVMQRINGEVETEIVSSEKTDFDSGTKVSIPVQKEDTERFAEAIEVYRNFSWSHPVEIDGELFQGSDDYVLIGDSLIYRDEDTELYGNTRILRSRLWEIFNTLRSSGPYGFEAITDFELGSWVYGAQGDRYSGDKKAIVITIVPALVEFSSSRDAITENEKLRSLCQYVKDSLTKKEFFESLFEIFRSFSNEEIKKFSRGITSNAINIDDGKIKLSNNYGSHVYFEGDLSLMDTAVGINPYYLRASTVSPNIKLAFGWESGVFRFCKAERQSLFNSSINGEQISRLGSLYEEFSRPAARSTSYYASALYAGDQQLKLVTGTTEKEFRSLVRYRDALKEHFEDNTIFAFSTLALKDQDKGDLEYSKRLIGDRLSFIGAEELLEELQETRKLLAKTRKSTKVAQEEKSLDNTFYFTKLIANFDEPKEVSEITFRKQENWIKDRLSLREFFEQDKDSILILGGWYGWNHIYIGAVNSDEDILGRQIYTVDEAFDANQWRFLATVKSRIYMAPNYRAKLKVTREIMAERSFHGITLNSVLSSYSDEQLIKTCVTALDYIQPKPLEQINLRLKPQDEKLKRYIAIALEPKKDHSFYIARDEAKKEMERRGINVGELEAFNTAASNLVYGRANLDDEYIATMVKTNNIPTGSSPIVDYILDHATAKLRQSFDARLTV